MAGKRENVGLPIPRALVEFVLLGPADDQRQLQDSPILGDVWLAYAEKPAGIQDLLITPHIDATAGRVAKAITKGLTGAGRRRKRGEEANIAYLQGIVAARLFFDEVLRIIVPVTLWWNERKIRDKLKSAYPPDTIRSRIADIFAAYAKTRSAAAAEPAYFNALERYIALAGLILWAGKQKRRGGTNAAPPTVDEVLKKITPRIHEIVRGALDLFKKIESDRHEAPAENLIFHVSLNRRAMPAVDKSVPAVKADAARTLFRVECDKITWAVLDSGIDATHDAFKNAAGKSRVRKTFDFTRVRDVVSRDVFDQTAARQRLDRLTKGTKLDEREARRYLKQLTDDAENEHPLNWDLVEEFVRLEEPERPTSVHGTHVAGIIGAGEVKGSGYAAGMCPDIQLYDFRVLARNLEDTEFAIIAALQYIRYVNELHNFITIHGVNLSLSIPHNVRNYACGRTPLCNECERLVESGVVVIAAAGNRGYQTFETKDGTFESYAAFSITDPGNADGVITVGSTHRNWPHTYGVSFFSSRGPTGDGRLKPDLVAPGERIQAPMPGNEWGFESGTSMAAPHVSGAAAMLMARYAELIGQPRRIKRILCDSATDLGRERSFQGHGMLDVLRAFQSI